MADYNPAILHTARTGTGPDPALLWIVFGRLVWWWQMCLLLFTFAHKFVHQRPRRIFQFTVTSLSIYFIAIELLKCLEQIKVEYFTNLE